MFKNNGNSLLHINSKTWIKDSNGLYDYESTQTKNLKAFIGDSICITRNGCELNSAKNEFSAKNEEKLFNIIKSKEAIYNIENRITNNIEPTQKNISILNNKIWYIINNDRLFSYQTSINHFHNTNKDYFITKNDIIKLGRVKYIVSEINNHDCNESMNNLNINRGANNYINELNAKTASPFQLIYKAKCFNDEEALKVEEEKQLCKICYSDEIDKINNPMVHLCNCKGGLNYAHFECIKRWMKTKLLQIENNKKTVKSYYINCFNCEICKTPYPFRFKINNEERIFELIEVERPINANYIILESLNQIKENCNMKSIHIISLTNDEDILIGRGHECDVRIRDISVSRFHCKLRYNKKNNSLLIKDLKSKFGTLVLIKTPFEIKEPIQIQIGRTYVKTSLISYEDLISFQKRLEMERTNKMMEKMQKNIQKNKNDSKYSPLETEYKEKESEDNNMDIDNL